jgi:hypothetical protein
LCAGLYLVQVTNGTGCITIDTAFVTEPQPIVPNLSTTPASCFGVCDGTATVGPVGGQPPYTYVWDPVPPIGQGTAQTDSLCAGTWTVVISDQAGCSITVDVLILEPAAVTATSTVTPITCNGACDGAINVVPSGGTAPYIYSWLPVPPNGDGFPDATGLCAGDLSVTITDANGCDTTYSFTLTDPPLLQVDVVTTDNLCFGDCAGTATITVGGGIAPYAIEWRDAGGNVIEVNTTSIDSLCAGDYSVVVTDANGCVLQDAVQHHARNSHRCSYHIHQRDLRRARVTELLRCHRQEDPARFTFNLAARAPWYRTRHCTGHRLVCWIIGPSPSPMRSGATPRSPSPYCPTRRSAIMQPSPRCSAMVRAMAAS